jgi:predicted aminopeptidase
MRSEFANLKSEPGDMAAYDSWFNRPLNNAQLISVSTYHDWVPAFKKILLETGGDLEKFYQRCRQLAKKKPVERNRILQDYISASGRNESVCLALD